MVESLIILTLFIGAILFLINNAKQGFSKEGSACAKNCGSGCNVKIFEENIKDI